MINIIIIMPVKFRLVGQPASMQYELNEPYEGPFNLHIIWEMFKYYGLDMSYCEKIRFITDSVQIKPTDSWYNVEGNETRVVFVFAPDSIIRSQLNEIFKNNGELVSAQKKEPEQQHVQVVPKEQPVVEVPPQPVVEVLPTMTPEVIEAMNKKSIELFANDDFKCLVRIYKTNPNMFSQFSRYIQHGNIVMKEKKPVSIVYEKEADTLEALNLGVSREELVERLAQFDGHMNLTLRDILIEKIQ